MKWSEAKWKFHDEIYTRKNYSEPKEGGGGGKVDIWMQKHGLNNNEPSAVC